MVFVFEFVGNIFSNFASFPVVSFSFLFRFHVFSTFGSLGLIAYHLLYLQTYTNIDFNLEFAV